MINKNFLSDSDSDMLFHSLCREGILIRQLGETANRFRPFNSQLAQLLEEIEEEQTNNYLKLNRIYQEKFGVVPLKKEEESSLLNRFMDVTHFFVVDKKMATLLLKNILLLIEEQQLFFQEAHSLAKDLFLTFVYAGIKRSLKKYSQRLWRTLRSFQEETLSHPSFFPQLRKRSEKFTEAY